MVGHEKVHVGGVSFIPGPKVSDSSFRVFSLISNLALRVYILLNIAKVIARDGHVIKKMVQNNEDTL